MKMYEVGGCIRDEIIGVPSKDIDFSVVLDEAEHFNPHSWEVYDPFKVMVDKLKAEGFKIHVEHPDFFTVIAQFPRDHPKYPRVNADFVLARKESNYDGRKPGTVEVGTLADDLARRDFTMNAIARDMHGNFIDPYFGRAAIANRRIEAVGDAQARMDDDALRAIRAMRFSITKNFHIMDDVRKAMESHSVIQKITDGTVSAERIAKEVEKMVRYDTIASIITFSAFPILTAAMFSGSVSLDASMKQKGRGK
jgi:tRNA nucleotidyltransferase (CCA-adding enzyme)